MTERTPTAHMRKQWNNYKTVKQ